MRARQSRGAGAPGAGAPRRAAAARGWAAATPPSVDRRRPKQPRQQVIVETSNDGFDATKVYREAAPGVVTIRSIFDNGAAEGSGIVLDTDGRLVTNAHVVTEDATENGSRKEAEARSTSSSPTATSSRRRSSASTPSPTSPCSKSTPTASTCTR